MASRPRVADGGPAPGVLHLQVLEVSRLGLAVTLPHLGIGVELGPLLLQLPEDLVDLEDSGGADGVHRSDQPAGEIGRKLSAVITLAAVAKLSPPSVGTQAAVLIGLN